MGRQKNLNKIPDQISNLIPVAEWFKNIEAWDKEKFIIETSKFLWEAYGIGCNQDRHTLAILANLIDTIIICTNEINKHGLVITHKNGVTGKNHHIDIRDKAISKAIVLMTEIGLTPKSRLAYNPPMSDAIKDFLAGPKPRSRETKLPIDILDNEKIF